MESRDIVIRSAMLLAAFGLAAVPAVHAQSSGEAPRAAKVTAPVDPKADPRELPDEEGTEDRYQPKGIEAGQFLVFPQLDVDIARNSNVYAAETDVRGDWVATARPELKLRSRFARHQFNLAAEGEFVRYDKYSTDDVENFRAYSDAIFDVSKGTEITLFGEYSADHEERGSNDDARGIKPTATRSLTGRVTGKVQPGRWTLSFEGNAADREFDDVEARNGPRINNTDRNRTEVSGTLRAGYEIFPQYSLVVAGTANSRDYDTALDDGGFNRDSDGYRLEGGVALDVTDLIRGDFLVGYQRQNYDDSKLTNPSGYSVRAVFNYSPSKITLIVPSLERSIQETTIDRAAAQVRTQATLLVRHEYARNIVLTAFGGYFWDKFDGLGSKADSWELRGRGTYAVNSWVYFAGEVTRKEKDSEIAGASFKQTVASIRVGLRY